MERRIYTRIIPTVILSATALFLLGDYFFVNTGVRAVVNELTNWSVVIGAFTALLAVTTVFLFNITRVVHKTKGWIYNSLTILFLVLTILLGLTQGTTTVSYRFLISTMLGAIAISVNAAGGLKFASGIYRSARARNLEAGVLFVVLCLMLLKKAPIGEALLPQIGPLGDWVDKFVSRAGSTGLVVGAAIGEIVLGVRLILGQQPTVLGGTREEK